MCRKKSLHICKQITLGKRWKDDVNNRSEMRMSLSDGGRIINWWYWTREMECAYSLGRAILPPSSFQLRES